jgi:hypothetical protein
MGYAPKTGHSMSLYRNTGTFAVPVWALVDEIGDVSVADFTRGLAELKRRANNFTKNLASLIQSIAVEFRLHFGLDETVHEAIVADFLAGTAVEWAIYSGAIATVGERGLRLPAIIENFPWDQPLEDVSGHDVRLATAYMISGVAEVDPTWQETV